MCRALKVSSSGYYRWLKSVPSKRKLYRDFLSKVIKEVYKSSRQRYGSPRIAKELQMKGIKASRPLVAKLMKREQIRSIVKKKFKVTTNSSHNYPVVENKLLREFTVEERNKVWVSDITYIKTRGGWLYLTTVMDLFDRKIIGWALSKTMKAKDTTIAAFNMAQINRPSKDQLLFHSDRGIQYACDEFRLELEKNGQIIRSMSRKGDCWDNAVAESFFKTLKTELIYHQAFDTREEAALAIFEFIEIWYNRNRRHKHLNNLTMTEYEQLTNLKNAA